MNTPDRTLTDKSGRPLWSKPWLTIPEVQRVMRVGRATIQSMVNAGRWTAVPVGKRYRIATDSIRADLDRQAKELAQAAA